jgi:hypothetical protein
MLRSRFDAARLADHAPVLDRRGADRLGFDDEDAGLATEGFIDLLEHGLARAAERSDSPENVRRADCRFRIRSSLCMTSMSRGSER